MLQLRGITKSYGGRRALEDVTFDVRPGRLTGFVGGNGAGKTTTMRIVPGAQLRTFADESLALATGIALHSDIRRSRLAYGLYAVGVTPFAPGTFLRTDGLRSIRRSYLPGELAAELGARWRVQSASPFRVVAIGMPGA